MLSMEGLSFGIFNQEVEGGFVFGGVCGGELECDLCTIREIEVGSVDDILGIAEPFRR